MAKCKRCGADEFRIHGFCSVRCDELWDLEEDIRAYEGLIEAVRKYVKAFETPSTEMLDIQPVKTALENINKSKQGG